MVAISPNYQPMLQQTEELTLFTLQLFIKLWNLLILYYLYQCTMQMSHYKKRHSEFAIPEPEACSFWGTLRRLMSKFCDQYKKMHFSLRGLPCQAETCIAERHLDLHSAMVKCKIGLGRNLSEFSRAQISFNIKTVDVSNVHVSVNRLWDQTSPCQFYTIWNVRCSSDTWLDYKWRYKL